MSDEPLEKLVARRIREQLGEGGLEKLIEARQRVEAQVQRRIEAEVLQIHVGTEASAEVTRPGEA